MPRLARGEYLDPHEVQVVHAIQRCVRRAFLCGDDPVSGRNHEHRRHWIRARLEFLASVFGIDCLTYTVLSNHLHIVLRSRPDIVKTWSDHEVARRWLQLFPKRRNQEGSPQQPTAAELQMITSDADRLETLRRRLSDISWWMRCTAENIARQANREDQCTGRFWEGRFKAQMLLDEASLLACAAYVDLNPVRAALARAPEDAEFTGAKDRIDDLKQRPAGAVRGTHAWERSHGRRKSGWMSPLEINERTDSSGPEPERSTRRASQKGFLPMSLGQYLQLLDWTGRQLQRTKRGTIPADLAPILTRIGLDTKSWCDLVQKFGRLFKRAVGTTDSLVQEAGRRGVKYMHAPGRNLIHRAAA